MKPLDALQNGSFKYKKRKNLKLVNLKCVKYTQAIPQSSNRVGRPTSNFVHYDDSEDGLTFEILVCICTINI